MPRFRLVFSEHGAALYKGSNMRGALALRLGQVKYQQEPQSDTDVLIIGGLPGVALRQEVERCVLRFTLDLNYDPLTSRLERHIRPATAVTRRPAEKVRRVMTVLMVVFLSGEAGCAWERSG